MDNAKTIQLHPAQRDFIQSTSLYRGFVGGIGSGKSWCLCYDLLKRARPGHLFALLAPTYSMLSDSTLRSFSAIADDLGIMNREEFKKSAPPSVILKNGAEILFRSADDPDRLRGPNLSGCAAR